MPVDCQMCCVLTLSLSLDQSLLLFSNIFICEGPEKGFPPDSWKMEKTIFKLEGKKCELSSGLW